VVVWWCQEDQKEYRVVLPRVELRESLTMMKRILGRAMILTVIDGGKENYGFSPFGPIMLSLVSFTNGIYCLIKGSAIYHKRAI
jgi:hypothetical protein